MGARLRAREGDRLPPLEIDGGALRPIRYRVPKPSAQVASCVLLAGLFAPGATTVEVGPARDHTERMLPLFGVQVEREGLPTEGVTPRTVIGPATLRAAHLRVPGDFSAAAFFLAAAAATPGASVTARDVTLNPTRTGLLQALRAMGATVSEHGLREVGGEPVGDVTVTGPETLIATEIAGPAFPTMIDEVPAWAMVAARAEGISHLRGAEELRVKESDRLAALSRGLRQLGVEVEESADGLAIRGGPVRGGTIDAQGDHRIAMAFAVLGTAASAPVTIQGTREIATSYPGFVEALRGLGAEVEVPAEDVLAR
jgi:3-phosphoshikimate 1-carboxyvinyltransferase